MALAFLNRCVWRATSGGTGTFGVSSAIIGYKAPIDCINPSVVDGGTYRYFAESDDKTQWEDGYGIYTASGTTLTRATVLDSSNAGSAVNFTNAPKVAMGCPLALDADLGNIVQTLVAPSTSGGAALGTGAKPFSNLFLATGATIDFGNGNVQIVHSSAVLTANGLTTLLLIPGGANNDAIIEARGRVASADVTARIWASSGSVIFMGSNTAHDVILMRNGTSLVHLTATELRPESNDLIPLGSATVSWSDLFLASGGNINWNNGNVTQAHSSSGMGFTGAAGMIFSLAGAGTVGIEMGRTDGTAGTAYIDFHSSATAVDYNVRILVNDASGATGAGTLQVDCGGFRLQTNDTGALGIGTVAWSDLFLASGAVINFNNGNTTITHSAGVLTFGLTTLAVSGGMTVSATNTFQMVSATSGQHITLLTSNNTKSGGLDSSVLRTDTGFRFNIESTGDISISADTDGSGGSIILFRIKNEVEMGRIDENKNLVWNTAANATTATNGWIYMPTCAGTPTGVPTTYTGRFAFTYDSTNNKFYVYNGAWKGVTLT